MGRLNRMLAAAAFIGVAGAASTAAAQGQPMRAARASNALATPELLSVRVSPGHLRGIVSDERGGPLPGAMVTVLGATMAMTVTDSQGRFSIESLPPGEYVLRAHLAGFSASRREMVRIGASAPDSYRLQLRRIDEVVATTGISADAPVAARPIMAAGFDLPSVDSNESEPASATNAAEDHPHTDTAWRLRHIRRSILKDASSLIAATDDAAAVPASSLFGRAFDSAASVATSLFADLPFSGEVNLLTTGAFGPGELFAGDALPRGIAYVAISAPMAGGDWSMRAAMSQGDLSSWIVAGAFTSRPGSSHAYDVGLSYSAQDYQPRNLAALPSVTEGSRNAGEVSASDRWAIASRLSLDYGARYARYDYLENRAVFSPHAGVTVEPFKGTRVTTTIAQRMLAPGAEEFVSPAASGPWLPPERTFSPLRGADPTGLRVERTRSVDVLVEHEFDDTYVVGVRRFYQSIDDQLVALFGLRLPGGPASVGHYYLASAGAVDADGWAVRVSSAPDKRVRGTIDYSVTRAHWLSRGDTTAVGAYVPAAVRPDLEDLHDVTTSLETNIPETSTRVFVVYKVNTGYTRSATDLVRPGFDGRFDVQVNQALPIGVGGTKWEVLLGLRNLFRDPLENGSVYDELLVVRPPKRVVGGFLVRF
jgi:hypothetical protein